MSIVIVTLFFLASWALVHVTCDNMNPTLPIFPIAVLCSTPDPKRPTPYDIPCQDRTDAYSQYTTYINNQGGMLLNGIPYHVNLTYFDVGFGVNANDITIVSAVAEKIIIDNAYGYFPLIIAPYSSLFSLVVAGYGEAAKRVVYASTAVTDLIFECPSPPDTVLGADCIATGKRPGDRRYQYTFATNPTAVNRWNGLIYDLKVAGAQTLAMIDSSDLASQSTGTGASAAASANNLNLVTHRRLVGNETLADRGLVDTWLAQLRQNYSNLDVLLINNFAELQVGCGIPILSLRAMNWLPKMIGCIFGPSTVDLIDIVGDLQQYSTSATIADPRLKTTVDPNIYPNDPFTSSIGPSNNVRQDAAYNAFLKFTKWRYPIGWSVQYVIAMFDMTVLQRALAVMRINYTHVANTSDPQQMEQGAVFTDALRQATQGLYEPTWFGRAQFDQVGRLTSDAIIGQVATTPNAYDIVYPLSSETAPFIYPIPTWDERVYTPGYAKFSSEKWVIGINTVVCAVSLVLAIFVIRFRNAHIVRASSPIFLLCMLLGCILMNSSIYTWTLFETRASCFAHVWLFSIGYILMFAPLFAKTWRLYRIFSSSNLIVQVLTDGKLFGYVCAPLLGFELIYLAIWSGVAPFEARTTVVDPIRPSYNYDSCYYSNISQGFFLASLTYKIAFLVAGCVLIFIARNIPSSFNETPFIGAAIYNVLFSSVIIVPIVATDALARESCFLVRSFGIMIATLLCQLVIVVPKMYHLVMHGDARLTLSIHDKAGISHSTDKNSSNSAQRQTTCVEMTTTKNPPVGMDSSSLPGRTIASASTSPDYMLVRTLSGPGPLPPSFISAAYEAMTMQQLYTAVAETSHKLTLLQAALQKQQAGAAAGAGAGTGDGAGAGAGEAASRQEGTMSLTATPRHAQTPRADANATLCRMDSISSLPLTQPFVFPSTRPGLGDRASSDMSLVHIQFEP